MPRQNDGDVAVATRTERKTSASCPARAVSLRVAAAGIWYGTRIASGGPAHDALPGVRGCEVQLAILIRVGNAVETGTGS
jgi:hypothetical protein